MSPQLGLGLGVQKVRRMFESADGEYAVQFDQGNGSHMFFDGGTGEAISDSLRSITVWFYLDQVLEQVPNYPNYPAGQLINVVTEDPSPYTGVVLGSFTGDYANERITVRDQPRHSTAWDSLPGTITTGWHFLLITWDISEADECKIFLDGIRKPGTAGPDGECPIIDNVNEIYVSASSAHGGGGTSFSYKVAEVALYKHTIYSSNRGLLYGGGFEARGNPLDIASDSLIAYWAMNEGSGSVVNDVSGNGHNAILVNNPTWVNLSE